jgi:hypothetical protein
MRAIAAVLILFAGHRNLFQYVEAPKRVVVEKKKAQPVPAVVIAPPVIVRPTSVISPISQAPAFPYRCIGVFGPNNDPFAVFDAGGAIINVRMGEVIDGKFIVRAIGVESITIGVDGFPEQQRIAIGSAR